MAEPDRASRHFIPAAMFAGGGQAIIAQSLLLREAAVLMSGGELAWGIVLSAWLAGISAGAIAGGCLVRRLQSANRWLLVALLATGLLLGLEIWGLRGARGPLGAAAGEPLSPWRMLIASLVLVSPTGILVGISFPLACFASTDKPGRALGTVYAWESAGSLAGGMVFSFWMVDHLGPARTVALCLCAVSLLCAAGWRRHRPISAALGLAALGTGIVAGFDPAGLDDALVQRRWRLMAPGFDLIRQADSRYQNLALGRREGQYSLYCDGQVSASFPDPYTHAPQVHLAMCQHRAPREVLIVGGGAEGILAELQAYTWLDRVDYVEPDPLRLRIVEPDLPAADRAALTSRHIRVRPEDARPLLKSARNQYDVVILNVAEPTSAQRARFFTTDFYRELRRAMRPEAVLLMTAAAGPTALGDRSASYLASIRAMLREHFPQVIVGWGDPALILAAAGKGLLTIDPKQLAQRYEEWQIKSEHFDPLWFEGATDALDPVKIRQREAALDRAPDVVVSTDLHPAIYLQRLAIWEQSAGDGRGRAIERLRAVPLTGIITIAAALVAIQAIRVTAPADRARARMRATTFSIGTTGFVTMALSIVWLFAFQSLRGYVYQRIGWIIALFMAGLVIGAGGGRRLSGFRRTGSLQLLAGLDVLTALFCPAGLGCLTLLGLWQPPGSTELLISALVVFTGLLGGLAFAVAGTVSAESAGRAASAAGQLVGADHLGACLGALATGLLLVPVYGIPVTLCLLGGAKAGSALVLLGGMRGVRRPAGAPGRAASGRGT